MKYALKSAPVRADVGVPLGVEDGAPELHPDVWRGVWKNFQMTNFDMPNNVSSMKYALKSVPGPADVGVPMGMVPELPPDVWRGSGKSFN